MTKQTFDAISFGERYMVASFIYIGIGLLALSLANPLPFTWAEGGSPNEPGICTYIDSEGVEREGCPQGKKCCDGDCYNSEEESCCVELAMDGSEAFVKGNLISAGTSCCNGQGFNSATEGCCTRTSGGKLVSAAVWNRANDVCCPGGYLFVGKNMCCELPSGGYQGYNTKEERCCVGTTIYKYGNGVYNFNTHDCCTSTGPFAAEIYDRETQKCCGIFYWSKVYYKDTHSCCGAKYVPGLGYTADVFEKSECDCCRPGYPFYPELAIESMKPVKVCDD